MTAADARQRKAEPESSRSRWVIPPAEGYTADDLDRLRGIPFIPN